MLAHLLGEAVVIASERRKDFDDGPIAEQAIEGGHVEPVSDSHMAPRVINVASPRVSTHWFENDSSRARYSR
jgi:hypothetical protein